MDMLLYRLPTGFYIRLAYDLCRARTFVDFQMKGGDIVLAHLVSTQDEVTAAYRAWRNQ
jgi:hypothetical protein